VNTLIIFKKFLCWENGVLQFESTNIDVSLSPSKTTTKTNEPSVIQGLINHYSDELPGYETNLERASDLASDEVMTESPQQQAPNSDMASLTSTNYVIHPEQTHLEQDVPELSVPKQTVTEQTVPELSIPEQVIVDQSPATNYILEPEISTNDQPPSSNLAVTSQMTLSIVD